MKYHLSIIKDTYALDLKFPTLFTGLEIPKEIPVICHVCDTRKCQGRVG